MTGHRGRGRLRTFVVLAGILCSCGAAPVVAQLQRGQLRLEVHDPIFSGTAVGVPRMISARVRFTF